MNDSSPPKLRWYRLTPDRFLMALLPTVGFLWLSERFRWFAFNEHKNWTVLIAVAVICGAIVLLVLWLGLSLVSRLRFQFSLRSLLVLMTAVAIVCSWFSVRMQEARRQREAIEAIDGLARYGYQLDGNGGYLPGTPEPPGPPWLRNLVGVDFLSDVRGLYYAAVTDAGLARLVHLKGLTNLKELWLDDTQVTDAGLIHLKGMTSLRALWLNGTQVTDDGLVHLKGLTSLQGLWLNGTQVTDAGVQDLQKALPNCHISRREAAWR